MAIGDINNDGKADVLIGAPGEEDKANGLKGAGSIIAYTGISGGIELFRRYGATAKAGLGASVAIGDVNGDGYGDLIAGAIKDDSPTEPKVTKDTGSVTVWSGSNGALINTVYGDVAKDAFGAAVSSGDINSDGKADLIIGIPGSDVPPAPPAKTIKDTGKVQVLSGIAL